MYRFVILLAFVSTFTLTNAHAEPAAPVETPATAEIQTAPVEAAPVEAAPVEAAPAEAVQAETK